MIIKLKDKQRELSVVSNRQELAKFVFELSQLIIGNKLKTQPFGVVIGLVGIDGVEVFWQGGMSTDEIRAVAGQITETLHARQCDREPRNVLKRNQQYQEEKEQAAIAYENTHPWLCDHQGCSERFKTERGAKQHEARCWRRPKP